MPRNLIGQILYRSREKLGLTLEEVAHATGMNAATVWRIEQGKTDPRFETQLLPIAKALGLPLGAFFNPRTATTKGTK